MTTATDTRLEYLRGELRAGRISMSGLIELQGLVPFIAADDVELLEAAGVPEFPEEDSMANPYTPGTTDYKVWDEGATAGLNAVQVAGESGGEWLTNIVMQAEELLGLVDNDGEQGACILTAENMHTADDCTMHDHERGTR